MNQLPYSLFAFLLCIIGSGLPLKAQQANASQTFSVADSLRGNLNTPLRTCYDVKFYHLDITADVNTKQIEGSNTFTFEAMQDFTKLQFDLFQNMKIDSVLYKGQKLNYTRRHDAVFLEFPATLKKGETGSFTVHYSGTPLTARNAPWEGGMVYAKDEDGKPWVATACQGLGASFWWPNKDQQADEPDSMLISIRVPDGFKNVSNGRLRKATPLPNGYTQFDWFVGSPINNYNVALNIGNYVNLKDSCKGLKGTLDVDYWVLPYNVSKARTHFAKNVKPMIKSFEHWFGPYPFYSDGYKLIETPHLGMEHQSGIAYGNGYKNGYNGRDLSGSGHGLKWDFIVVHESGHEWFGNSITSKDIADMWIHESFTAYSECLFVEGLYGKKAGREYVYGTRRNILNDKPITGAYNVNNRGSGDMYYKGSNMLHTLRTILGNDTLWRQILTGLNQEFYHQTVTAKQVIDCVNEESGRNLSPIFDQYLNYTTIPTLLVVFKKGVPYVKWKAEAENFEMPVGIWVNNKKYHTQTVGTRWKALSFKNQSKSSFIPDTDNYYINVSYEQTLN